MKTADFIKEMSKELKVSKSDVSIILNRYLENILNEVEENGKLSIPGFGTFRIKTRAARLGINPKTKEKIKIPESKSISFKMSKKIKEKLN